MTAKTTQTRYIGGLLNTPFEDIRKFLKKNSIECKLITDNEIHVKESLEIQKKKHIVYNFISSTCLIKNIKKCYHPPLLWETASTLKHISLNQKVKFLDSNIMLNGMIFFIPFSKESLLKLVNCEFVSDSHIAFERTQMQQFGNDSKLSLLLNNFLGSLPITSYEPTIVAFATAFESNKYKPLDTFLKNNRLVTDENKENFEKLIKFIESIRKDLREFIFEKKSPVDKDLKKSLSRAKFLVRYFGTKKIEDYLDKEDNVQVAGVKTLQTK